MSKGIDLRKVTEIASDLCTFCLAQDHGSFCVPSAVPDFSQKLT